MSDRPTGHLWAVVDEWLKSTWHPPSQNQLAARLEISPSSLSDIKYGRVMPKPPVLRALAAELGVPYQRVLDAAMKDKRFLEDVPGLGVEPDSVEDLRRKIERNRDISESLRQELLTALDRDTTAAEPEPDVGRRTS